MDVAKQLRLLCFLLSFCAFSNGMSLLGETVKCRSYCARTYPLHTYPSVEHLQACQQGCYGAAKHKAWSALGFRFAYNCSRECSTKFATGSYYGCKLGCAEGLIINNEESISTAPTLTAHEEHSTVAAMILRPVLFLHTYGRGMINRLTYYIYSSSSYYFSTDNGGVVIVNVQSQPQVYMSSFNGNEQHVAVQNYAPEIEQPGQNDQTSYTEQHESWIVVRHGHHWLHCVSYKSGVPVWILSYILFLSSFFLLWLCCAATSPAAKKSHKSPKKAFFIKGFLSTSEKKDVDVPLISFDEEEQAEALPSKAAVLTI